MDAQQVNGLFAALQARSLRAWAAGGWAADALAGKQSRPHADLDLAVDAAQLDDLLAFLAAAGFRIIADWLPSRVELAAADGRLVDLHPVHFAADGSGYQCGRDTEPFYYAPNGFAAGTVDGRPVPCLGLEQQLRFRTGYPLRDTDRHDLALLHRLQRSGRHDGGPENPTMERSVLERAGGFDGPQGHLPAGAGERDPHFNADAVPGRGRRLPATLPPAPAAPTAARGPHAE